MIMFLVSTCASKSTAFAGQTQKEIEYRFKAVYILNFLRFVAWPDSVLGTDRSPFVLAVLGNDPFGKILEETFQSETVAGHPIEVKRYRSLQDLGACQALFISASERELYDVILKQVAGSSILTISDAEGFGERGGHINFFLEDNKIRFEINVQALKEADLKASSKLLRLAKIINGQD
jgi:hypothetical protein